jgi:putative isomerase
MFFFLVTLLAGGNPIRSQPISLKTKQPPNILDYSGNPDSPKYRDSLAFSDQGAWFAYGFSAKPEAFAGFSGPFLMTQENGVWSSNALSQLKLTNYESKEPIDWKEFSVEQTSYNSHLEQVFTSDKLQISQTLFYTSPHTALITTSISNLSDRTVTLVPVWSGSTFLKKIRFKRKGATLVIKSEKSKAIGYLRSLDNRIAAIRNTKTSYTIELKRISLAPKETTTVLFTQSFIFPEYNHQSELKRIDELKGIHSKQFEQRVLSKEKQLSGLYRKLGTRWSKPLYKKLLAKTVLTLQNNWRIPAGELKHSGLFPSYHYIWFHGFWAWDSWKHSVALARFDPVLAREQMAAMYDFMDQHGFIADVVYRDTSIEKHNFRNTKPPLSGWAAWKIFEADKDIRFLNEVYPKIVKQHRWWYKHRDHDGDGLCEYGSTDGTLKAAKWESGMDNAVRFDNSKILENSKTAYSLDQESVDLNSYLFAEKVYLAKIAKVIGKTKQAGIFEIEAESLKKKIQTQFFDKESGWFYDTSLDGTAFIKEMGCEGWIPLWAKAATPEQAADVRLNMMNPKQFNTRVPFQTLSASHPKFKPDGGYWRGPTWMDQAYFGVKGLRNYGYAKDANSATYKLIHNAEGVLGRGRSIRENYQPITGKGLESKSFSWSAAHYLLLLINEENDDD